MIVPMAVDSPALLSATLVLSALHQNSLSSPTQTVVPVSMITGLKASSLRHLQSKLVQPRQQDLNMLMATVRTLFLTEIYDSSHRKNTWRAHYRGARALVNATSNGNQQDDESAAFLRRWFSVTEGLIALTPDSIPEPRTITEDISADDELLATVYLDEYGGTSTDMSDFFRDVGLAIKVHQSEHEPAQDKVCSDATCRATAGRLERRIREKIARDQVGEVIFHPRTASQLSNRQMVEFALCNRAYQYSVLLHIQKRLFDLPAPDGEVQETVSVIIDCVEGISPSEGLSPLAVLTTPLFVAGCEAFGPDRAKIRRMLDAMYVFLRVPNIERTSMILGEYWASMREKPTLSWTEFAKLHGYDFLPY